jgi:hypothetical protein
VKRLIPLALAIAWHLAAHAADTLPAHVAGSWGTADSLHAGATEQTVMYLQADGFGLMGGSSPPARGADGAPRAIAGFPVRAALEGDTLRLRPALPKGAPADLAASVVMTCRYDAAAPSFTCTGPDKVPIVLRRLGATLPPEAATAIAGLKAQENGS